MNHQARVRRFLIVFVVLLAAPASLPAAVLPTPVWQTEKAWYLPGDEQAVVLAPEQSLVAEVAVPALSEKEAAADGSWRGVLAVDIFGTPTGGRGVVQAEAFDSASGNVFAKGKSIINGVQAPRAKWSVIVSSEQDGAEAGKAFDGDPKTDWHSRYGANQAKPPHWIGLVFSEPRVMEGARLLPRQGGFTNGVPRVWRLEVRESGGDWQQVAAGESDRHMVADKREAVEVRFDAPRRVEAFRFVIEKDWSGGGFGTAAEVTPIGVVLDQPEARVSAVARIWVELPPETMLQFTGKSFGLRVTGVEGQPVLGEPRWCRVATKPGGKLFGRSNGGLGPDRLAAGLLGFTAMTEHQQTVLPVIDVLERGPAAVAGLRAGDAIVSVAGKPLPINDLNPGWDWFRQSHEATLGRASEAQLSAGKKVLELGVLRSGKVVTLPIRLRRTGAFTTMNPADDPQAAILLRNMIDWILENQRADGSWSGDIKRTTLAALALLATGDKRHDQRVQKAVEWSLAKFDTPEKHGNLGFWGAGYMGVLYAEWHLRSGDDRVLPHLTAIRDWAYEGRHPSAWGVPALGHGPSGLPYDQKSLVAPACHLLVFESLARRCGMESKLWEMLLPYMEMAWSDPSEGGHGALGYNKSFKDLNEFWSRSGLFAMTCHLRGERSDMRDAMTKVMVERHSWFRNSHAYGEPGGGLGLLGLQLVSPGDYADVIRDYAWWFSLAWQPGYGLRFTQPHMGAPYMGEDDLMNVVYALVLQSPRRNLHLTGKPQ